jgi:hypothetical protein
MSKLKFASGVRCEIPAQGQPESSSASSLTGGLNVGACTLHTMNGLAGRGANTIPAAEWPDSIQRGGSDGLPATCRGVIRNKGSHLWIGPAYWGSVNCLWSCIDKYCLSSIIKILIQSTQLQDSINAKNPNPFDEALLLRRRPSHQSTSDCRTEAIPDTRSKEMKSDR